MDKFTKEKRSQIMALVKNKNTKPEIFVRSLLHKSGFRFQLFRKDLPGSPDIILPKYGMVIFVHGCFWHGHKCPRGQRPVSNRKFWNEKLDKNKFRDKKNYQKIKAIGWKVEIIWECEAIRSVKKILKKLKRARKLKCL